MTADPQPQKKTLSTGGSTVGSSRTLDVQHCLKMKNYEEARRARPTESSHDAAEEIDYLMSTSDVLFKYYSIIEGGAADGGGGAGGAGVVRPANSNSILSYFTPPVTAAAAVAAPEAEGGGDERYDRATLHEQYILNTDANACRVVDNASVNRCSHCASTDRTVLPNDGLVHCRGCHGVEYMIIDHDRPSYKDPPKEISYFAYKRINHFNEWISQIQGKETTEIPDEIYDSITMEIKKQKITNVSGITCQKVKEILKKLKINKYYEHVPHIINKLCGVPMPYFYPDMEEKLRSMFKQIQPLFIKYAPPNRKNFLSYSYVLHKFVQLLGRDEYLPYFSLLKSREKLHQQDMIWQKICAELNWQYIKSI